MTAAAARRDELTGAFMLLTRLPVAGLARTAAAPASCVWAYPLAGAAVGVISAAAFALARMILPPAIAALCAVAASILATGGLHEDGLADTADGFGGGATPARKLEIMRDSRIGSFGAMALMLTLALRTTALAALDRPGLATTALVISHALARGAILILLWRLPPARQTGLAAPLAAATPRVMLAGLALAAAFAIPAPAALPAALAAALIIAAIARRQIGGYTGDVLGAAEQAAECAALAALLIQPP